LRTADAATSLERICAPSEPVAPVNTYEYKLNIAVCMVTKVKHTITWPSSEMGILSDGWQDPSLELHLSSMSSIAFCCCSSDLPESSPDCIARI
jgi:hypothetical protein